jgi:hypothetical protein
MVWQAGSLPFQCTQGLMEMFQKRFYYREIKHDTTEILTCCHLNLLYADIIKSLI